MNKTYLCHHGVKGQKWGIRRFQNEDGSLTKKGQLLYSKAMKDNEMRRIRERQEKEEDALNDSDWEKKVDSIRERYGKEYQTVESKYNNINSRIKNGETVYEKINKEVMNKKIEDYKREKKWDTLTVASCTAALASIAAFGIYSMKLTRS